jgi:hypothetical protein
MSILKKENPTRSAEPRFLASKPGFFFGKHQAAKKKPGFQSRNRVSKPWPARDRWG